MFGNDYINRLKNALDSELLPEDLCCISKKAVCTACGISTDYLDRLFEGGLLRANVDSKKHGKVVGYNYSSIYFKLKAGNLLDRN